VSSSRTMVLPPALQAAKAATKALIRAVGGQEAAAAETGKSHSRFACYGLPNTLDFIPVNDVHALEAVTHGLAGHPHVTRWLAREAGYALVRLPQAPGGTSDWHQAMGAVSKEVGEIIERLCTMLADGKVTGAEVREGHLRDEIRDAQERLAQLDALAAQAEADQ
jgi:hypothetical protein